LKKSFRFAIKPSFDWVVYGFNNISIISWGSGLLVEETGVHGENHRLTALSDQFYHISYIK
jgi:hypothetical protein